MSSPSRPLLLFALLLAVACGARAQVMATPPALPGSHYNPALFENPVPAAQLEFLRGYIGRPAKELMHNKQFWKLAQAGFLPHCTFHYGRDRPLAEAFDWVVGDSKQPVAILQGRYLVLASDRPQQLDGEAMLWIDLEAGIGVGAFYFHPVNGEPTPTVNVFARQVVPGHANLLEMSQLPPAFRLALMQWTDSFRLPPLTPRYFLTGNNRKILLEHDEDYCRLLENTPPSADPACEQRNAEAAKIDVVAASYIREAGFATNATAFFMPAFRVAWMAGSADKSGCAHGPDLYPCQIAWSRARVRTILDGR